MFLECWGQGAVGNVQHGKLERMRAARWDSSWKKNHLSVGFSDSSFTRMWLKIGRDQKRPLTARICVTLGKKTLGTNSRPVYSLFTHSLSQPGELVSHAIADYRQLIRSGPKLMAGIETPTERRRDSSQRGGEKCQATDANAQNPL